jgi:hypothetical protein
MLQRLESIGAILLVYSVTRVNANYLLRFALSPSPRAALNFSPDIQDDFSEDDEANVKH